MIRVLYDYQIFASQAYGGISRYCHELCKEIARMDGFAARIEAPLHINAYLREDARFGTGLHISPHRLPAFASAQKAAVFAFDALASVLRRGAADIVHETFYYGRFSGHAKGAARVVTVHDMIHEKFPASFPTGDQTAVRKREAVMRADHIICNSQRTRSDLLERLGVPERKVSTVYLGFSFPRDDGVSGAPVDFPYLLYVGNRGGYKNFDTLVAAVGCSAMLRRDFGLVCFGGGRLSPGELSRMERAGLDARRIIYAAGDDCTLARYYRHAAAFVYPSLYEGFGIPPLEAMANDCPVVCGAVASLPEVVGLAAEFCTPQAPESIRDALEAIVGDQQKRHQRVMAGRERTKLFSWENCARETAQVYRSLRLG